MIIKLQMQDGRVVEIDATPEEFNKLDLSSLSRPGIKLAGSIKRKSRAPTIAKLQQEFSSRFGGSGGQKEYSVEDDKYILETLPGSLRKRGHKASPAELGKLREMCEHLQRTPRAICQRKWMLERLRKQQT